MIRSVFSLTLFLIIQYKVHSLCHVLSLHIISFSLSPLQFILLSGNNTPLILTNDFLSVISLSQTTLLRNTLLFQGLKTSLRITQLNQWNIQNLKIESLKLSLKHFLIKDTKSLLCDMKDGE